MVAGMALIASLPSKRLESTGTPASSQPVEERENGK